MGTGIERHAFKVRIVRDGFTNFNQQLISALLSSPQT